MEIKLLDIKREIPKEEVEEQIEYDNSNMRYAYVNCGSVCSHSIAGIAQHDAKKGEFITFAISGCTI